MSTRFLVWAGVVAVFAQVGTAVAGPTTMALVPATGDRAPAAAVLDRLEAAWLGQPGVALVERAQLEKILAEHQITGSALVDPGQRV
ncbi:hypothetical protein HQ590_13295, partial [bacterium]|nr:hypothetical protein [bacterium]